MSWSIMYIILHSLGGFDQISKIRVAYRWQSFSLEKNRLLRVKEKGKRATDWGSQYFKWLKIPIYCVLLRKVSKFDKLDFIYLI